MPGDRAIESIVVVFQFNDLRLRHGRYDEIRRGSSGFIDRKYEIVIRNLGDHIPEVIVTSTCRCRARRRAKKVRTINAIFPENLK